MKFRFKDKKVETIDEKYMKDKTSRFFIWLQEFSKKVVAITFLIFIIINIFILTVIGLCYFNTGELMYLDTLISEANVTFREVIGGYIIKAAVENAIKISGAAVEKYWDYKMKKDGVVPDVSDDPDEELEDDECELVNDMIEDEDFSDPVSDYEVSKMITQIEEAENSEA